MPAFVMRLSRCIRDVDVLFLCLKTWVTAMRATLEELSQLADLSADINKHKLRSHIAKTIEKVLAGKRFPTNDGKEAAETGRR